MHRSRFASLFLLAVWWVVGLSRVGAAPNQSTVLILPIVVVGQNSPVGSAELGAFLRVQVGKVRKDVQVLMPPAAELAGAGYTQGDQPPSPQVAAQLVARYQCGFIAWVQARFQSSQSQPGRLTMNTSARFWAWNGMLNHLLTDEPMGFAASGTDADAQPVALAQQSALHLMETMVSLGQKDAQTARVQAWQNAAPAVQATDPRVATMGEKIAAYQKAVANDSAVDTNADEAAALSYWSTLNATQKAQVEQTYPGTRAWLGP